MYDFERWHTPTSFFESSLKSVVWLTSGNNGNDVIARWREILQIHSSPKTRVAVQFQFQLQLFQLPQSQHYKQYSDFKANNAASQMVFFVREDQDSLTLSQRARRRASSIEQLQVLRRQADGFLLDDDQPQQQDPVSFSTPTSSVPSAKTNTVHGLIIDAGSTGSRMHVYEFEPRILDNTYDVSLAVAGRKLSIPGTHSRWTERLSPGLSSFAFIHDDSELRTAISAYLTPLISFAKDVLADKEDAFDHFPIYLKATGGMRELLSLDRKRIMRAVRYLFTDPTFNPFAFKDEYARTISGEEEAVFGWTGINFLMQTLLDNTAGQGTVVNPNLTYGALDMGGASAQISFFDPRQDVMSNLFKLQLGASKHWNVYAHSFLHFGVVSAYERLNARLYAISNLSKADSEVYNPCLPGKSSFNFTSNIGIGANGIEFRSLTNSFYNTLMINTNDGGDFEKCASVARLLLQKGSNAWCSFSHNGDCSFAGVYQPQLPNQSERFGEFLAFSNFYDVWKILRLDSRSNLIQLQQRAATLCSMSLDELILYNEQYALNIPEYDLPEYCFRSAFVFEMLHDGFGFSLDSNITAANVINGHKVTWALGSMLYEINTLPWIYVQQPLAPQREQHWTEILLGGLMTYVLAVIVCSAYRNRKDGKKKLIVKRGSTDVDESSDTSTRVASNVRQGYGSLGRNSDRRQ